MNVIDEIFDEVLAGSGGGGGITPTGTKQITANGLHDVTQYAAAQVAVPNELLPDDQFSGGYHDFTTYQSLANIRKIKVATVIWLPVSLVGETVVVDDKVMVHGDVTNSGTAVGRYVMWGTVTEYDTTKGAKVVVAGVAIHMNSNFNATATSNGTVYVNGIQTVTVNVPNTYEAADEGKVVSNGALVSQTSKSVVANGTYNTTNNNQVVVNVPPSSGVSEKWAQLLTSGSGSLGSVDLSDADVPAGRSIYLRQYIFYRNNTLRSLSSEVARVVDAHAFDDCRYITSLYLPNIREIKEQAFNGLGQSATWDCDFNNSLRNVETVGQYAFMGSKIGGDLAFPAIRSMSVAALSSALHITGLSLPNYDGLIPALLARYDNQLKYFNAPLSSGEVRNDAFSSCTSLEYAVFGAITLISTDVFSGCTSLKYIVIGGSSVCSLASVNAFDGCSALESIYVPDDLVDSYKAATNWSTFASKIKPVSEMSGV